MAAPGVVARALDGTPLYAARGELPVDVDEQRVQCHLCGGGYRALGSSHLSRVHGVTADEYRELVGLRPRHPLWAPDLIDAQSKRLRARLAAEPRLRAAMAKGHALARRGELQREATSRLAQRPTSLERERQLALGGARLGNGRAARHSASAASCVRWRSASPTWPPTTGAAPAESAAGSTGSPPSSAAPRAPCAATCSGSASVLTGRAHTARAGDRRVDAPSGTGQHRAIAPAVHSLVVPAAAVSRPLGPGGSWS